MKRKILIGILFGAFAGIIDVIPMIIQRLSWDANLSAFTMWVVVGFFIASSEIIFPSVLKGIIISFLVLSPCAIIIGWQEPQSLIPIGVMTLILGSLLGLTIERFGKTYSH